MSFTHKDLIDKLKSESIKFLSFCYIDIAGKLKKKTYLINELNQELLVNGIGITIIDFNGNPLPRNLKLIPDVNNFFMDPFSAQPCCNIMCNIIDADDETFRDCRGIAFRVENLLKTSNEIDSIHAKADIEFYILNEINHEIISHGEEIVYHFNDYNDEYFDLRAEMCLALENVGVEVICHSSTQNVYQNKIAIKDKNLLSFADDIQKFKYIVVNVARSFGKHVSFEPYHNNIPQLMINLSFVKRSYSASSSDDWNRYLKDFKNGILRHIKSLNAFSNPHHNNYGSITKNPVQINGDELELRFIDSIANPYLTLGAIYLAGLDDSKIIIDENENLICSSFSDALNNLKMDNRYLTDNEIFTQKFIDYYISEKSKQIESFKTS